MDLYTEPNGDRQPDPLVIELTGMRTELTTALALNRELVEQIDRALVQLAKGAAPSPVPGKVKGIDLARVPLKRLVDLILEQRGARSAAWLRTKLHQRLEARRGRRLRGGGRDRVVTNGHGKPVVIVDRLAGQGSLGHAD